MQIYFRDGLDKSFTTNELHMKTCSKCKVEKDTDDFAKDKYRTDSLTTACKECRNTSTRAWNLTHKPQLKEKAQRWFKNNKHKQKESRMRFSASGKRRDYVQKYEKLRRDTDVNFKLRKILRTRLWSILKGQPKEFSSIEELGCSSAHLKLHLELFWDEGMSWDNYGFGEDKWNVDHIYPLSIAKKEGKLKEACHYTNLQPMWQKDNFSKSNKVVGV